MWQFLTSLYIDNSDNRSLAKTSQRNMALHDRQIIRFDVIVVPFSTNWNVQICSSDWVLKLKFIRVFLNKDYDIWDADIEALLACVRLYRWLIDRLIVLLWPKLIESKHSQTNSTLLYTTQTIGIFVCRWTLDFLRLTHKVNWCQCINVSHGRTVLRMWDTLHTAFDGSSATLSTVGGGGWGRCIDWQRPVGGTTMTTDAATSSVKT